jgi:hypothetical protein
MKKVKLLELTLVFFVVCISTIFAAPLITSVSLNTSNVGTYEKLELTVGLSAAYDNPFNPNQVDLKSVFVSPSLSESTVCGFWNGSQWKIRFAANTAGAWNYTIYLSDSTGGSTSTTGSFTSYNSAQHGWVRVSKTNPRYFDYDDGTPYFGLGQNRPWHVEQAANIYSKMSTNGMNVLGYWFVSWDNRMPTMTTGYDRYDMGCANAVDLLVDTCERTNIQLYLAVWAHIDLRDLSHSWGDGRWESDNPFQLIPCTATTFFTNSTSWQYQQNLYRYIIARWGYSRAIGWWHTITEIDGTCAYSNDSAWHYKINDYFQKNDPFRHPTTASKSNNLWAQGFVWMDSPQVHIYGENNAADSTRVSGAMAIRTQQMWSQYSTKPNVVGEFGTQVMNSQPTHQHNATWAGVCTGAAIAPLVWHDGGSWGDMGSAEYATMKVVRAYISDIPFSKMNLQPATISVNTTSMAVYGMKDTTFCYLWIQDSTPAETITNLPVTISGLNNGAYSVYWWDTWSGVTVLAQTEYAVGGTVRMFAPSFKRDIAAKMYRVADAVAQTTTFWDFDTSNESWISGGSVGSATFLSGPIQVETPTHTVTNNGSIYYTFNLTPSGSWSDIKGRSANLGGLDWSNYNTITAYIYTPAGAPTLQAKLYTESGVSTTYREPAAITNVPANTWTALVLNKTDIYDAVNVHTFGFKLGHATNNYTNGTVYFDYVTFYGNASLNPIAVSLVGSLAMQIGESRELNASGGYPPYTWSIITTWTYNNVSSGYLNTVTGATVTFTATGISTCYLIAIDSTGQMKTSPIIGIYPQPLQVTVLGATTLYVSETRQLTATNGYPPYSWAIITTSGSPGYLNTYTGGTVTFTTASSGSCYLRVTDNYGNIQTSQTIVVTLRPLVLTLSGTTTLFAGETRQLFATDGYPPYSWSIITTNGKPGYLNVYTGATVTFTAASSGSCYLQVRDNYGQIQISQTVVVTLRPLVLDLNGTPTVTIGQTRKLIATDGYPPYSWSIFTTSGIPGYLTAYTGATVTYNATGIGACYVQVRDSYGQSQFSSTLTSTATQAPLINPTELETVIPKSHFVGELFE